VTAEELHVFKLGFDNLSRRLSLCHVTLALLVQCRREYRIKAGAAAMPCLLKISLQRCTVSRQACSLEGAEDLLITARYWMVTSHKQCKNPVVKQAQVLSLGLTSFFHNSYVAPERGHNIYIWHTAQAC
jgi:hypothetical protein